MPAIDTRHAEKTHLFSLYQALLTGDIETQISSLEAAMEKEDIEQVLQKVEEWKKKKGVN